MIVAIDPGHACGIVVVRRDRIIGARTTVSRSPRGGESPGVYMRRMRLHAFTILADVVGLLEDVAPGWRPGALEVVVEAFGDQKGRRHYRDRWKTPVLCGALEVAFAEGPLGVDLEWQDAGALAPRDGYGELYDLWKRGRRGLIPGDDLLTDEHRASAACHALYRARLNTTRRGSP